MAPRAQLHGLDLADEMRRATAGEAAALPSKRIRCAGGGASMALVQPLTCVP